MPARRLQGADGVMDTPAYDPDNLSKLARVVDRTVIDPNSDSLIQETALDNLSILPCLLGFAVNNSDRDLFLQEAAPDIPATVTSPPPTPAKLGAFVDFLYLNKIFDDVPKYLFDEQVWIQKYAFLAQCAFGLHLGYEYHVNEYGAFSSLLAAHHYSLTIQNTHDNASSIPWSFDADRFVSLVLGRNLKWLRLATVIIHTMQTHEGDSLRDRVCNITDYDTKFVKKTIADISSHLHST